MTNTLINPSITNCFSVDVESFTEANLECLCLDPKEIGGTKQSYEIEKNMDVLLELMTEYDVKATFFILGRIAKDTPVLVKRIAGLGHEIACHSFNHFRITGQNKNKFKNDLFLAKKCLEDVSGQRLFGFRAPDFSITKSSTWALEIIKEAGFLYDSSIYPIIHDVYGMKEARPYIHRLLNGLIEFPLSTTTIFGRHFPFGGGGYFRLYPPSLTKMFISKTNKSGHPCIFYIHPYEVGPEIPAMPRLSYYRKFRHYYNCGRGQKRLRGILQAFKFAPAIEVLKEKQFLKDN
jgi:polysaccharide deacetylase family protein (PEP-CTERM system associated)